MNLRVDELRRWLADDPWRGGLALVGVVLLIIAIAAAFAPGGKRIRLPSSAPDNAVAGTFTADCGGSKCTSPDAAANLRVEDVWCAWRGRRVVLEAKVTNGMNASVKLSIVPKYFIEKGGQHGTSLGSDVPIALAPRATKTWRADAGAPEGVPAGTPISSCEPRLLNIDIG